MFIKYKKAFTLAEILITLTVIGIIAAITIPAVITEIQDQQLITAWKNDYQILDQAARLMKIGDGGYITLSGTDASNKFIKYLRITKKCRFVTDPMEDCWYNKPDIKQINGDNEIGDTWYWGTSAVLLNGSLLQTFSTSVDCSSDYTTIKNVCAFVFIDVNGHKSPNTIGKDIFEAILTRDGLTPMSTKYTNITSSDLNITGGGYSAAYLHQ